MALTPDLHLHLDALVLDGVAPGDPRVAAAVTQAARRALADQPQAAHASPEAIAAAVTRALAEPGARP